MIPDVGLYTGQRKMTQAASKMQMRFVLCLHYLAWKIPKVLAFGLRKTWKILMVLAFGLSLEMSVDSHLNSFDELGGNLRISFGRSETRSQFVCSP